MTCKRRATFLIHLSRYEEVAIASRFQVTEMIVSAKICKGIK